MHRIEAIYQINNDGVWMDYFRQTEQKVEDAKAVIRHMAHTSGKPFRARVEDWSEDGPRFATIYYGDWDKSQLSPAAQDDGIFVPDI